MYIILSSQFHSFDVCHVDHHVMLMFFVTICCGSFHWKRRQTCQHVICLKLSITFGSNDYEKGVNVCTLQLLTTICEPLGKVIYIEHTYTVVCQEKV